MHNLNNNNLKFLEYTNKVLYNMLGNLKQIHENFIKITKLDQQEDRSKLYNEFFNLQNKVNIDIYETSFNNFYIFRPENKNKIEFKILKKVEMEHNINNKKYYFHKLISYYPTEIKNLEKYHFWFASDNKNNLPLLAETAAEYKLENNIKNVNIPFYFETADYHYDHINLCEFNSANPAICFTNNKDSSFFVIEYDQTILKPIYKDGQNSLKIELVPAPEYKTIDFYMPALGVKSTLQLSTGQLDNFIIYNGLMGFLEENNFNKSQELINQAAVIIFSDMFKTTTLFSRIKNIISFSTLENNLNLSDIFLEFQDMVNLSEQDIATIYNTTTLEASPIIIGESNYREFH